MNKEGNLIERCSQPERIITALGGQTRFHSVKNGLKLVEENSIVFVHDGVRCLVSPDLIRRCYEAALENGNVIPAIPVNDSIRMQIGDISSMVDRENLFIVQTPQTFFSNQLKKAFEQEFQDFFTDEASVAEKFGIKIHLIAGEDENIKITRPVDLLLAETILENRKR